MYVHKNVRFKPGFVDQLGEDSGSQINLIEASTPTEFKSGFEVQVDQNT